jgi:pyruvate ferredoxin oxidoreductase alpha subunit
MAKQIMETSKAIAHGAKLSRAAVIPMYPITPQTHIVERIADFINNGEMDAEMIHVESEHSAISAAIGSAFAGSRTFTATASQGFALMHEILHIVSGLRCPVVMAVANRALSAPINIWNDHQDTMSARDAGWIQLYCENSQEAIDTTIMAFKIAENPKVSLPVMVCVDGFTLSHMWEPVDIPEQDNVDKFLPKYKIHHLLDPKKPVTIGPIGYPDSFMQFKLAEHEALKESLDAIKDVNDDFKKSFGRKYGDGLIELYKMDDAEYAVLGLGTVCGTARVAVDDLRKKGKKVGMIKLKCYRPFPKEQLKAICKKLRAIAVIDRNISLGYEGAVFSDLRSALSELDKKPEAAGYILGLGGRDITDCHIKDIFEDLEKGKIESNKWMA